MSCDLLRAAAEALIAQADHLAYQMSGNAPILDLRPLRVALNAEQEAKDRS